MSCEITVTDRVYARVNGQDLKIRIYRPSQAPAVAGPSGKGAFPAMIDVHGGAWTHFDHTVNFYWCRELARRGFVMCSVEFRQAPQHPWPIFLNDLRAATRWVRAHADELGIDPANIGAIGGSTGGHLATLLGLVPDRAEGEPTAALDTPAGTSAQVNWVVALWPILDVPARYRMAKFAEFGPVATAVAAKLHEKRRADGGGAGESNIQGGLFTWLTKIDALRGDNRLLGDLAGRAVQWFLYLQGASALGRAVMYPVLTEAHEGAFRSEAEMEQASPFHIVESGGADDFPPMLVVQGARDSNMTPQMTGRFAALYRSKGGHIETHFPSLMGHSFGNVPGRDADRLVALVENFVRRPACRQSAVTAA